MILPPQAYKTYSVLAPRGAFRKASCVEVDCPAYLNGFKVLADETSDDGRKRLAFLRGGAGGRKCREVLAGPVIEFYFPPGTTCFRPHKVRRDDRPSIFLARPGDTRWRLDPRTAHIFEKPEHFVEDFATNQDQLIDKLKEG